jgi:hypothetical protein
MNTREQLIASGVLKTDTPVLARSIIVPVNQASVKRTLSRINAIIARRTLVKQEKR